MRVKKGFGVGVITILCAFVLLSNELCAGDVLAKKSLDRWMDPVVLEGRHTKEVLGSELTKLRVYAYTNGSFQPIRFQIDEITGEKGDIVFAGDPATTKYGGPVSNAEQSNGKFDAWDLLVFHVNDLGDRVTKDAWTPGFTKGSEIEVTDPLTGEKAWVYVLSFASKPPPLSSLPPYVEYDYDKALWEAEYIGAKWVINEQGLHTIIYAPEGGQWTTAKCALSAKDALDRVKVRATLKMVWGSVTMRVNEDVANTDEIAYKVGPIRLIRRMESYSSLPGGVKALRTVTDNWYYRNFASVPSRSDIGVKLGNIFTSAVIRIGVDWNPKVIGSTIATSNNPKGCLVDGKMDDGEASWNSGHPDWFAMFLSPQLIREARETKTLPDWWMKAQNAEAIEQARKVLLAKEEPKVSGGVFRFMFPERWMKEVGMKTGLTDDVTLLDPPERYPGCFGYIWEELDITNLSKGSYFFYTDFYTIPFMDTYHPEKSIVEYCNFQDHPLKIKSGGTEAENMIKYLPNLERKFRSCLPRKGVLSKGKMGKSRE